MKKSHSLLTNFEPMLTVFAFVRRHWIALLSLGLIGGCGRVIQLGGFGEVSNTTYWLLEILIEGSRVAMLLFVIGLADVGSGFKRVVRLFSGKIRVGTHAKVGWSKFKQRWLSISLSFIAFAILAAGINLLIDQLAYQTCLLLTLKREGVLVDTSSEWTILLFFKNISVIPFTLVFETMLFLWLTNQWPAKIAPAIRQ